MTKPHTAAANQYRRGTLQMSVVGLAALAFVACAPACWGQTATPEWGAKGAAAKPIQGAQSRTSAWGSRTLAEPVAASATPTGPATPTTKATAKTAVAPELAAILKRPDSDVITGPSGQRKTVGEIRKAALRRQATLDALHAGKLPPGWKVTHSPVVVSKQRAELVSASVSLRDAARTEASMVRKSPMQPDPHVTSSVTSSMRSRPGQDQSTTMKGVALVTQLKDGIWAVNQKVKGIVMTPGGEYAIAGRGFGDTVGQLDIVSKQLPGGKLALQITQWDDGMVRALIPEPLRGLPDHPITLRATTRAGTLFSHEAQFFATREEIAVSSEDGSLQLDRAFKLALSHAGPISWQPTIESGFVRRTDGGIELNCENPGDDRLELNLPSTWAMTEVSVSTNFPTVSNSLYAFDGEDGNTVMTSVYAVADWSSAPPTQRLTIHWGVFRSHISGYLMSLAHDDCWSSYSVQAKFVGPAGLKPF